MAVPLLDFDRLRSVESIQDEKEQCEMFTRQVVFTVPQGDTISDADINAFLGGTGSVLQLAWGGPDLTSRSAYVDDFRLQSWLRRRREPVQQAQPTPEGKKPAAEDEIVATYTRIVAGTFRSTVTGSLYMESTKGKIEGHGIHVGSPWRKGMEGYYTFVTYGFSTIDNDPGSPQVGMTRTFTIQSPGTVTSSTSVVVTGVQTFGAGTGTAQQPATATINLVASVANVKRVVEWSMGRYLYETEWRAWVPMGVYGPVVGPPAYPTVFYLKPRQEIGKRFQIRGKEIHSTVELVFRYTDTWQADLEYSFPQNAALPIVFGNLSTTGQVLLDYKPIINTWSGECEVELEYGKYIGGSGLIGAGYLLPYSKISQNFPVQVTDPLDSKQYPVYQAGTSGTGYFDADHDAAIWYSTGNCCVTGFKLDFDMNPMTNALASALENMLGYVGDGSSGVTAGMLCLDYSCEMGHGQVRVCVYFAKLLGAVKAQKYINQGGTVVPKGTPQTIAFVGTAITFTGFTGSGGYILPLA